GTFVGGASVAVGTLTLSGGTATLAGGGTVGMGDLSGGTFELGDPVTAHYLTAEGAEVVQATGADLTVDQFFVWTAGDINADGNEAALHIGGATGLIAPQDAGTVTLGSTLLVDDAADLAIE